ncbi:MAG: hypothetical protein DRQ60_10190 [Gammaproteobacteria bacterium]|nr:MAG: hypothetical protein DRQ60_10190 [Gammaproteobacteria bacterium]
MVAISLSGSGEGPGWVTAPGYSTAPFSAPSVSLYTDSTPNGRKTSIALAELGLDYELKWVKLDQKEQMTPEFLALNPNHKIPVLEDDGQVISSWAK